MCIREYDFLRKVLCKLSNPFSQSISRFYEPIAFSLPHKQIKQTQNIVICHEVSNIFSQPLLFSLSCQLWLYQYNMCLRRVLTFEENHTNYVLNKRFIKSSHGTKGTFVRFEPDFLVVSKYCTLHNVVLFKNIVVQLLFL